MSRQSPCVVTVCLALVSCGMPPPTPALVPMPVSPWGDRYSYSYETPESGQPGSVPVTIIVVDPDYKDVESVFGEKLYWNVGKGFSSSMAVDMDKLIIAKGMTVKGPVAVLDEITYSDKKGADLTLVPKVFFTVDVEYVGEWQPVNVGTPEIRMERQFAMKVGGWVSFVLMEPLTAEKMWIKKLEMEEILVAGFECAEAVPQLTETKGLFGQTTGSTVSGYSAGNVIYDGKLDALANALKKFYPTILSRFWTYLDPEELEGLKSKVDEIRKMKVYD
jgi:hypothetical protein